MENFFALIIGVGGDLAATAEDATAIKNLLCDPNKGGYLPENIAFLVNDDSTKKNVIDSLENIMVCKSQMIQILKKQIIS